MKKSLRISLYRTYRPLPEKYFHIDTTVKAQTVGVYPYQYCLLEIEHQFVSKKSVVTLHFTHELHQLLALICSICFTVYEFLYTFNLTFFLLLLIFLTPYTSYMKFIYICVCTLHTKYFIPETQSKCLS